MIIVFDIGTSRLKVSAFSLTGELLGQNATPHARHEAGSYAWQSTDEWWQNAVRGFRALLSEYQLSVHAIEGISVSGRAGAGIFLDATGKVIVEPWLDNRHQPQLQQLRSAYPKAPIYTLALLAKYQWLQAHEHETSQQIRHCLYAKDYLLFKLTGQTITDPSSGPDGLFWPELTDKLIDVSLLPTPALPWSLAGELTGAAASQLGCSSRITVAVGAHDGICANTGCGMLSSGDYALTLGTHAVSRTVTAEYLGTKDRFYCYPPNLHTYGGNSWHIGAILNWALRLDGWPADLDASQISQFNDLLGNTDDDPDLLFLPYLGGQSIPENRPAGRGEFHGLSLGTTRQQMIKSIFQCAAFAIYRTHRDVSNLAGAAKQIRLTGGGIIFGPWLQMISNLLQQPLDVTDTGVEGRGAAIFCATALGYYQHPNAAASAMQPANLRQIEPMILSTQTADLFTRFEELSRN